MLDDLLPQPLLRAGEEVWAAPVAADLLAAGDVAEDGDLERQVTLNVSNWGVCSMTKANLLLHYAVRSLPGRLRRHVEGEVLGDHVELLPGVVGEDVRVWNSHKSIITVHGFFKMWAFPGPSGARSEMVKYSRPLNFAFEVRVKQRPRNWDRTSFAVKF